MPTPAWPSTGVTRWWLDGGGPMAERVEAIAAAVESRRPSREVRRARPARNPVDLRAHRSGPMHRALPRRSPRHEPGPVPLRRGPGARAGVRVDRVPSNFIGIDAPPVVVKDMLLYSLKIHQSREFAHADTHERYWCERLSSTARRRRRVGNRRRVTLTQVRRAPGPHRWSPGSADLVSKCANSFRAGRGIQ